TYTPTEADEGGTLSVTATYTDSEGNVANATGSPASAVVDQAPTLTAVSIDSLAPVEGDTLTALGSVAGESDDPVTYQWKSSADGYTNVIGTGSTYQVQEGDGGAQIEVVATATNDNGVTISQTSKATAAVLDHDGGEQAALKL